MLCSNCHQQNEETAQSCCRCGGPLSEPRTSDHAPDPLETHPAEAALLYAGFWRRLAALILDMLIVTIAVFLVGALIGLIAGDSLWLLIVYISYAPLIFLLDGILVWLYFALMESSGKQATLGKIAIEIKVVDLNGNRVSFGRATGRYFAKLVSGLTFSMGYVVAAFTKKKQALHDIMASCLVVRNNAGAEQILHLKPGKGMSNSVAVILSAAGGLISAGVMVVTALFFYQIHQSTGDPSGSLAMPGTVNAEYTISAPSSVIGAGESYWVDSNPDPEFTLINARVDIGTMRQVGDEIEVQILWPSAPGDLMSWRATHPDIKIPDGSQSIEREQVVCGPEDMVSFMVESTIVAPDGVRILRRTFNPAEERLKAETSDKSMRAMFRTPGGYSPNPRSLVCWAAARKCEGKDFSWPPPPNNTPLEYSERATRMRAEYNRMFVPTCVLK